MTKALKKNIRRSITGSLGRYIAILLIIMLGVAFFSGLKLTRPAMIATATDYLDETKLYDLRLLSTLGFDDDDVAAVSKCDGVTAAAGSISRDFLWMDDSTERVLSARMLTDGINLPHLIEGRLPQKANECVVDAKVFGSERIGQTIRLADDNDADTLDAFTYPEYTVVGRVESPFYMDVQRGTSALGSGSVYGFVLIPEDGFHYEYYTELYVKCAEYPLYSDEYDAAVEQLTNAVEDGATVSVTNRYETLKSDAETELSNAERELNDQKAETQADLDDAKAQLEDSAAELTRGESRLADAKVQLDEAKAQLDEGAARLKSDYTSWDDALSAGWAQYNNGKAQLEQALSEGEQKLSDSADQLNAMEQTYADGMAQLDAGRTQYEQNLALWQSAYDTVMANQAEYDSNYAAYQAGLDQYEQAKAQFDALKDFLPPEQAAAMEAQLEQTRQQLDASGQALADAKAQLDEAKAQLNAQKIQLDAAADELNRSEAQLNQLRTGLDEGWNQYNTGKAELDSQRTAQTAKLDEAKAQLEQFESGIAAYRSGLADYEDGLHTLEEGRKDYEDGLAQYQDGVNEFNEKIADAEEQIGKARDELSDLKEPTLYVLDRKSSNSSYVGFKSDSMIVDRLSAVFPVFFFLIAALVCSTTMTRMIDDDRTQIGTLRALGYSRGSILAKYLIYSGSAALIGCLAGFFLGGWLFPLVLWTAYKMLYNIPGYICVYHWWLLALSLAASLLCSAGVTWLACRHEMRSTPADLIRPKTPAVGKRILLERWVGFWKHLKFLHKVSLRNIFRFKKRMIMMILGIAGCTALVLTGFGIEDSIAGISNYQFDDIQKYDMSVTTTDPIEKSWQKQVENDLSSGIKTDAVAQMSAGELIGPNAVKSVYFVASNDARITQIIDLHLNGRAVPYPGAGEAVITQKLAKLTGVQVGDTVTISISDTERGQVKVVGLAENYVQNYVYLSGSTYADVFGAYAPKTLLVQVQDGQDEYALSTDFANTDGVANVTVVTDTRNLVDKMMVSLDYVVALVLASAAALAFIVLFNLGNINISERVREIATIKVLGFHRRETGAYVFRENIILCGMGIVFGLPLGVILHRFVMSQIQVDMVSFKCVIKPLSFLLTVALVLLFSVVTDLILRRKINRIDMAESLKSIE